MRSCNLALSRNTVGIAACVLLVAACGGPGFAKRADDVCTREARALRAAPDYQHRVVIAQGELVELRALRAPELHDLVAALAREVDAADRLRIAATIGDTESAAGAYHQGQVATADARAAARRAGIPSCR